MQQDPGLKPQRLHAWSLAGQNDLSTAAGPLAGAEQPFALRAGLLIGAFQLRSPVGQAHRLSSASNI